MPPRWAARLMSSPARPGGKAPAKKSACQRWHASRLPGGMSYVQRVARCLCQSSLPLARSSEEMRERDSKSVDMMFVARRCLFAPMRSSCLHVYGDTRRHEADRRGALSGVDGGLVGLESCGTDKRALRGSCKMSCRCRDVARRSPATMPSAHVLHPYVTPAPATRGEHRLRDNDVTPAENERGR